ncbi:Short chain dehydrogenase citE [Colletotrichum trifolii]|uniref:Short chain dehydrogenase citE n=1 Tax=Colletotrichum trifolii TaxID=5466 RepID=A0A4R8R5M9_COLTR|nr:Short chain dehydrogenase citE [Colletotrichum trifolii]
MLNRPYNILIRDRISGLIERTLVQLNHAVLMSPGNQSPTSAPSGLPPRKVDTFTDGIVHHDTYPGINPQTASNCTGKAILVTGASKGLGKAIAIGYAEAGASHIAVAARSDVSSTVAAVREAAEKSGREEPTVLALEMDVGDTASVKAAAARLAGEWGRLDVLVNNAGYMAQFRLLLETDDDEYMKAWDVNYWGTYRVTKAFLPLLLEGGDKTIVNMSSVAAHFMGAGGGAYHVSKFALIRFTEFVQDEYADKGILAYSVHPGGIPTELSSNLPEKLQFRMTDTPELAAHSIPYLTSERREWLGGRWVSCMWDMPKLLTMKEEVLERNLLKFTCAGL